MQETTLVVRRRTYLREQYACHIRLGKRRVKQLEQMSTRVFSARNLWERQRLRDEINAEQQRIVDVMTRWVRRCLRDQPCVVGNARVEIVHPHEFFIQGINVLRAWSPVFCNVEASDREPLARVVDAKGSQAVEVRYLSSSPGDSHHVI